LSAPSTAGRVAGNRPPFLLLPASPENVTVTNKPVAQGYWRAPRIVAFPPLALISSRIAHAPARARPDGSRRAPSWPRTPFADAGCDGGSAEYVLAPWRSSGRRPVTLTPRRCGSGCCVQRRLRSRTRAASRARMSATAAVASASDINPEPVGPRIPNGPGVKPLCSTLPASQALV
jgi:hypothetical protein